MADRMGLHVDACAIDCRGGRQIVEEHFAASSDDNWSPRYNIAPQPVPVIRQNPKEPVRELSLVRWGLIPSWAKDSSVAARMINARSETAAAKPAFRDALRFRSCLAWIIHEVSSQKERML